MRFHATVLALLPAVALADWRMWDGSCNTGLGDGGDFPLSTTGTNGCDGCGAEGTGGGEADFDSGNPCNCDDTLTYQWTGSNYRIIVASTGIDVGECNQADLEYGACMQATYSCSMGSYWACTSTYCEP